MKILSPTLMSFIIVFSIGFFNACCCNDRMEELTFDSVHAIPVDNSGRTPVSPPSDSIPYKAFAIEVHLDWVSFSYQPMNWSFISSAYALSCDDGFYFNPSIDSILISSTEDFNAEFQANQTLNDLFTITDSLNIYAPQTNPITFYLDHEGEENKEMAFVVHIISGLDTIGVDTTDLVRLYRNN